MASKPCAVCTHPDHAAIDAALLAGAKLSDTAQQFDISKFSLGRHRSRHLFAAAAPAATDADEISLWLQRADQLFLRGVVDSDSRTQVAALGAALKVLDSQAKMRERAEAEATELSMNPDQWSEKQSSQFLSYIGSVLEAGERLPHAEDEYALALSERDAPDLHKIFLMLQSNPSWKRRVQEFCEELFAGEREHDDEFISQQVAN
jgi:hypothetical protein